MDGNWTNHAVEANSKGEYVIGSLIDDSGGMAEIYNVETHSDIVCKISRSEEVARDNVKNEIRIFKELEGLGSAISSRTVMFVDHGERMGEPFILLKRLDGKDLHDEIKVLSNPMNFNDFVLLATDILLAIENLHYCNIIHRDIKPKNLRYVETEKEYFRITILDFGISLELGESLIDLPNSRHLKCKSGGYSPPESSDDKLGAQPSFDIYSVGAIMFYCATLTNPPEIPSDEGLHPRTILPTFDKNLNDWVAKCTHPLIKKRFQSAREAIDALHAFEPPFEDTWVEDYSKEATIQHRNKYLNDKMDKSADKYDLVIVMDSTESMEPYRERLKQDLETVSELLYKVFPKLKITLIGIGDYESDDIFQKIDNLCDKPTFEREFNKLNIITGGGDDAEAYEFAFSVLARQHKWRADAPQKMVLVIGDSFSHGFPVRLPYQRGEWGQERDSNIDSFNSQLKQYCSRHKLDFSQKLNEFENHNFPAVDNHGAKGTQYIETRNPILMKLHTDKDGKVRRPNIDKAIEKLITEQNSITINTLYCGVSKLSKKFFEYLAIRGEGVLLKMDSENDVVAAVLGLILSTGNDKNYQLFVEQLNDEQTVLLAPATELNSSNNSS